MRQAVGRLAQFGSVAALLAWVAVAASCSDSPTAPGPAALAVTCPVAQQVTSPDGVGATVAFTTPTATGGTPPTTISCSPASGSSFAIGSTTVVCTARDGGGQAASCSFVVTVNRPPNDPPTIAALTVSPTRVEVSGQVQAAATVTDADTPPSQLQYQWTADRGGTFTGQGASVTWQVPNEPTTPVDARLTVTVIEPYQTAGGPAATGENRVSRTSDPIHIHNSIAEISNLAMTFLSDFSDSSVSPATCVRNFSDTCQGKQDELGDITDNRAKYVILSSTYRVQTVNVVTPFAWATVDAPCRFTSRDKATNVVGTVDGTCTLTATFQQEKWWLCDSHFQGVVVPAMKDFFGRGKAIVAREP